MSVDVRRGAFLCVPLWGARMLSCAMDPSDWSTVDCVDHKRHNGRSHAVRMRAHLLVERQCCCALQTIDIHKFAKNSLPRMQAGRRKQRELQMAAKVPGIEWRSGEESSLIAQI